MKYENYEVTEDGLYKILKCHDKIYLKELILPRAAFEEMMKKWERKTKETTQMEIVIKLHEKDFESIKKGYLPFGAIADAIRNGTLLPKGHGRLIDADELKKDNEEYIIQYPVRSEDDRQNKMVEWINEDITNAPTIIEGSESK